VSEQFLAGGQFDEKAACPPEKIWRWRPPAMLKALNSNIPNFPRLRMSKDRFGGWVRSRTDKDTFSAS
jgi:hypothetical protein